VDAKQNNTTKTKDDGRRNEYGTEGRGPGQTGSQGNENSGGGWKKRTGEIKVGNTGK